MTLVARDLREASQPLGAVGRKADYTSEYAFARAFKRQHGIAPGHYRQ
jgi:AraC-like DNA-binding protein